jgi:hypothetical protein
MKSLHLLVSVFAIALVACLLLFSKPPTGSATASAAQASCHESVYAAQTGDPDTIAAPDDTAIVCDVPITDTIETAGDSDLYSFAAADGDMVHISGAKVTSAQHLFHPVWRLLKRTGVPDDVCGEFTHLAIPTRDCGPLSAADSPYRIEVADENHAETGIYHLHYQLLSGPTCHARGLSCLINTIGEIETPADSDLFTFTVANDGIVKVTVVEQAPYQPLFHVVWRVLKSNGVPAVSCGEFSHLAISARDCGPLPAADSPYRLEVEDENRTETGHYSISLTYLDGSCPDEPTPTPTSPTSTATVPTATPTTPSPTPTEPTATPTTPSPTPTTLSPTPTRPSPTTPSLTPSVTPLIEAVRPNQGRNDLANTINIQGAYFAQAAQASLGLAVLTTTVLSTAHLQAIVPAGIAAGIYDVSVINPDGGRATLVRGYTAFDAVTNDDLFALEYEFYLDPVAPRANTPANLILKVHRQGGKDPLLNVKVRFYQGDPKTGGVLIGERVLPVLSPREEGQTQPITWTPTAAGDDSLYAVIDPDNVVAETYEDNNTVQRTVSVLPPAPDQEAPHVDSFVINGGASTTAARAIRLDTEASDEPASGRVAKLLFVEYAFSEGAGQWVPIQWSDWLDYAASHENYTWQLSPPGGVKALHAWAADEAGNISRFPFRRQINYLPPSERVEYNQRQIYRYTLTSGQTLVVQLNPLGGDPDLYIWPPDYATRPPWVSNLRTGVDDVSLTAPISGVYQVEVYGFSAANYQLTVNLGSVVAAQLLGGTDPSKVLLSDPLVPPTAQPDGRLSLVSPGQSRSVLLLPMILTDR